MDFWNFKLWFFMAMILFVLGVVIGAVLVSIIFVVFYDFIEDRFIEYDERLERRK